jgi:hypothetical protein
MPELQEASMPENPDSAADVTKSHLWIQEGHSESIVSDSWNISTKQSATYKNRGEVVIKPMRAIQN